MKVSKSDSQVSVLAISYREQALLRTALHRGTRIAGRFCLVLPLGLQDALLA